MQNIDLTRFKGVILTDSQNTLNSQLLALTGDTYSDFHFERLGKGYIKHIKTGDIYYSMPKEYLLTKYHPQPLKCRTM